VVAIHAIDGMPGVGKTALAVHVGHRLADRFPDRQLFLDLHAHTAGQQPMTPEAALASLLTADGADARHLPENLDERAALWRDRMAHKRVLLILDNAASSSQVTPLLPGSPGCLVLVTSRRYLGDLPGAVPMLLDILPPEEAQQMFLRLAPGAATEPTQVAELVALCGRSGGAQPAEVLNHSGTLRRKLGDLEQALAHHQRALDIARAVGSPLEQARALDGAGRCALARGDTASAVTQLRQALEIYQRIGAAEATQLATDLADLDAE
jgi:tetratricopeptide (TPR) repeat protein